MKKQRIFALGMLAALLLTSCGSSSTASHDAAKAESAFSEAFDGYGYAVPYAEEAEAYSDFAGASTPSVSPPSSKPEQGKNDLASRKIIRNANVSFETLEYDEFLRSMTECIAAHGGYVEASESYGGGIYGSRSRSSYLTARIPADRYDVFMNAAAELGTLTYRSENSEDVTMSYLDTESRLKSLRTEYDALLEILDKAESLEDVILLQTRISEVTYEIESYESSLRKYDDLISYCTVRIDISEVVKISVDTESQTFGERITTGLRDTFTDIGEDFADFTVWFVVSLPYILIWAVIIAVIVLVIWFIVRRRKEKKQQKQRAQLEQYLKKQNEESKEHKEVHP